MPFFCLESGNWHRIVFSAAAPMPFALIVALLDMKLYTSWVLNRFNATVESDILTLGSEKKQRPPSMEKTMPRFPRFYSWFIFFYLVTGSLFTATLFAAPSASAAVPARLLLRENWRIQSSCQAHETGEQISSPGFHSRNWHSAWYS